MRRIRRARLASCRRLLPALVWGVLVGWPIIGCTEAGPSNLLIVSIDTLRSDHTSAYAYPRDTTPHLARFAAQGARFEESYSATPTTGPSHATLFTGLYPIAHGVVKNGASLADEHVTLAERLRDAGYQTAAFVSSFPLDARFGYAQGFDVYQDEFARDRATVPLRAYEGAEVALGFDRRARETTDLAIAWLEEDRDPQWPFFLFVHYFDPHAPYQAPSPFASRFRAPASRTHLDEVVRRYDAEIAFADAQLGRLLAALQDLQLEPDTLAVITSDHGEELMEHGSPQHGVHLYEEVVRIPLVVRWPGRIPEGSLHMGPVALVDVANTVLDLLGVEHDARELQGRSLAGALRWGEPLDPERPIFLQRRRYEPRVVRGVHVRGERFAVRQGRWKYVVGDDEPREELFDLALDPDERSNQRYQRPEQAARLASILSEWRGAYERPQPASAPLEPSAREGLRALGYVE